jgi:hypothetical protein
VPKNLITRIESLRAVTFQRIGRNSRGQLEYLGDDRNVSPPPTNESGFYWLHTDYSTAELIASQKGFKQKAIDLPLLASLHDGLSNVCSINHEGFRLVYNGIAEKLFLRPRISQHFNGGDGTGSLHILGSTLNNLERWRVSYVATSALSPHRDVDSHTYIGLHAKHYERMWRLEHGWPIFCSL